jgi:hypothetical protein
MSDIVVGDEIEWTEPVWDTAYSTFRRGRRGKAPAGERTIRANVLRESYGERTGQHTFTLEVLSADGYKPPAVGETLRRKGRNLYGNLVDHMPGPDVGRDGRADDKHRRGDAARQARAERMPAW